MGSLTNFAEVELLDHVFNAAYSPVATLYLCLCTADPTDAALGNSMNEVANQYGYQRTAISFGSAGSRAVVQDADVDFPQASGGGWGTVSHWAIATSQTYDAGDVVAHGAFNQSKNILENDQPSVASGEVDVTISAGEISDYLVHKLLDLMFNNVAYSKPSKFVALSTSTIQDTHQGSDLGEPGSGSYAREQVDDNGGTPPTWDLAVSGDPSYVDNGDAVPFTQATANWGTIVAMAICDIVTTGSGNILFYDNDMADKPVDSGDTANFAAAALVAQMS